MNARSASRDKFKSGNGEIAMGKLTDREKEALINTVKKIHIYKLMQTKGYEKLVRKAKEQRAKQLLLHISANEARDSEYWSKNIEELEKRGEGFAGTFFTDLRISLMMHILGTRGFFEWTIIAEDESIEELAIQAENIHDAAASEKWTRIASDERLHVERMKREVLGMESWEMGGGGGVRDIILGANDGLVSILALMAGVYGATTESHPILIAGVAGAVAGAISMGTGAYLSSKSEKEVTEKENERKGIRKKRTPEEEKEKLVKLYRAKGFKEQEAEAITSRVTSRMELMSKFTVGEEIGLTSEESWPPIKAAVLTGSSFAIASLIPILPFIFMDVGPAVITAVIASIATLFAVGASKTLFSRKSWLRSGLEMMVIGTLAAATTYAIGLAFHV